METYPLKLETPMSTYIYKAPQPLVCIPLFPTHSKKASNQSKKQKTKMEPRMGPAATPMIKDFVPKSELVQEEDCDTLILSLPSFLKEQLKVQLTSSGTIRISGERPLGNNTWERFTKEIRIPNNCDTKAISAKFENGILYVRQPKMIKPEMINAEPLKEAPITQKPVIEAPSETTTTQEPAYANGQDKQGNQKTDKQESFDGATQKMNEEEKKKKETNENDKQDVKGVSQNMQKEEEKKKPPVETYERSNAADAENVPEQTQVEAKSDGAGELTGKPEESEQRNGDSIDSATNLQNESNLGKSRLEYYKQPVDAIMTELNKPRLIMKLAMVASVGLAIGLFISRVLKPSQ